MRQRLEPGAWKMEGGRLMGAGRPGKQALPGAAGRDTALFWTSDLRDGKKVFGLFQPLRLRYFATAALGDECLLLPPLY